MANGLASEAVAPPAADVADFYDAFSQRLLRDYVYSNPRIERAIARAGAYIDLLHPDRILDIGCGIGASSSAFVQRLKTCHVYGVDISPQNVATAQRLFAQPRLSFSVGDLSSPPDGGPFDLVVMIDVYEHIPADRRPFFNRVIAECLSARGTLVLATPSPLHQEYLAAHQPEELQIVDETITLDELTSLASAVNGAITVHEWIDVWSTNQYVHTVIQKSPRYDNVTPYRRKSLLERATSRIRKSSSANNTIETRRRHIRQRLQVEI